MFKWLTGMIGRALAVYLSKPIKRYEPFSVHDAETLRTILEPGDILLVEGNLRFSTAIKYVTQSTWSHAVMFVGDALKDSACGGEPCDLIEAGLVEGVIAVPLSKYAHFNTRIARAVGLTQEDREAVVQFMVESLGKSYDLSNIIDLVRYLLPTPPVPVRFRRRFRYCHMWNGGPIGATLPTRKTSFCTFGITAYFHRVTSTSRRISRSWNLVSCTALITTNWRGLTWKNLAL